MIPDNECPICGFETRRDGETVICHECGDVTDAVYDGFVVRLQDLDDSDTPNVETKHYWDD